MRALIDTNVLVYRFDPQAPRRQRIAHGLLRQAFDLGTAVLAYQSVVEFVAAARRPRSWPDGERRPLLPAADLAREVDFLLQAATILLPTPETVRLALRGMSSYRLPWFDAHLWAYAEQNAIAEILSEDFQDGFYYGTVRVRNPFRELRDVVHQDVAPYDPEPRDPREA